MTNNDDLALKLKVAAMAEANRVQGVQPAYWDLAKPELILVLLAERDADKKRIADMQAIVNAAEKLVRCKGRYHSEQNYRVLAALFSVTTPELPPLEGEARTVSVPTFEDYQPHIARELQGAFRIACAAAGINLEVGE